MTFSKPFILASIASMAMANSAMAHNHGKHDKSMQANPQVVLTTNKGNIVLELYPKKAPASVKNFINYVKSGHYNGTIFHRVIDGFMIQGGGFTTKMVKKPTKAPIKNEADNGLQNSYGTIAMARTNAPHSATNQFFINVKDNRFLNHTSKSPQGWGYTVFGKVVSGLEVVNAIKKVPTTNKKGYANVPVQNVIIKSAQLK